MIAAWMLFSLATGAALTAAAAAVERVVAAAGRPRRAVWAVALVATAAWPLIAALRSGPIRPPSSLAGGAVAHGAARLPGIVVPALPEGDAGRRLDAALLAGWAVASAVLLVRLAATAAAVRRWRRAWPPVDVDGARIRVAPDAGPAVVGLRRMEVVLPAWALALDRAERALILRHEAEHQAARDPHLLAAAVLLTALVPWHPALWWQAHRLRLAVELDCDVRVLRADPRPAGYARLLLHIAQRRGADAPRLAPAFAAPLAGRLARPTHLERRITAMRPTARPTSLVRPAALGVAALAAVAVACAVESPDRPTSPAAARAATPPKVANLEQPFFEFQVEEQAALVTSPRVRYPDALRTAGRGGSAGQVLAQFIVDTTGRVDSGTVKVLRSTHPAFTAAVEAALPTLAFRPARVGGRPVKQLVQLPFEFAPPRGSAGSRAR